MEIPSGPEGVKKINWRQFGRHWIVVFILAILAAFVIWGMLNVSPWLKKLQDWRAARALQSEIEKLYRNDKYGGKTPEETFDMFIAALEKGDIELASKYFVLEKQESWLKTLEEYKTRLLLLDFIQELKSTSSKWEKQSLNDPNVAVFKYKVLIGKDTVADFNGQKINVPKGDYTNETVFQRYLSNVWKISEL
jgi:hypothetical protein